MDGCDAAYLMANMVEETLKVKYKIEPVIITDNRSLYNTIHTSHLIDDKRLRVELSAIRQLVDNNDVKVEWTEHHNQLSDVLTKKGASNKHMIRTMQSGRMDYYDGNVLSR